MAESQPLDGLVAAARSGNPRAIGRLISLVENADPRLPDLMAALAPDTGRARIVGITGAPGVGKSSTVTALVGQLRGRGERVAVLAVDPSSPFTGGALLGDRVRMQRHATDPGVFIRSMATRGHLGGLAVAAPQAVRVLDAAGFETVVVETVGVGQSEIDVAQQADVTAVLLAPGMGDGVQAAKAGILEIADVFVVNKSDRDGAHAVVRELRTMLALGRDARGDGWTPAIVSTVATDGTGVGDLVEALDGFVAHQQSSGAYAERRLARARAEVEGLVTARVLADLRISAGPDLDELSAAVRDGRVDAFTAADRLAPS